MTFTQKHLDIFSEKLAEEENRLICDVCRERGLKVDGLNLEIVGDELRHGRDFLRQAITRARQDISIAKAMEMCGIEDGR